MSQSLIAFDTDHIKRYVFGTSKLKEIRGASSILDHLNRDETVKMAKKLGARKIFAHGGSALFLIDSEKSEEKAEQLGKAVQKLYHNRTGGGASITYAVQPIPDNNAKNIMTAKELNEHVTMWQVLQLLRLRLRLAKDSQQTSKPHQKDGIVQAIEEDDIAQAIALPTHALLCACKSCGMAYAEGMQSDPDEPEGRYCRVCIGKRDEDEDIRKHIPDMIRAAQSASVSHKDENENENEDENEDLKLWERILQTLSKQDATETSIYRLSDETKRPPDFQAFRDLTAGKGYLGLIYADANSMGQAIEAQKTLQKVKRFAKKIDKAVFEAMGDAIRAHLPVQGDMLPFDILLVGGDDIVMVTPADKALQVAHTLAERFHKHTNKLHTLSVGVVLAPVTYPFNLQRTLAEDILKDAKKAGAAGNANGREAQEQARISFVVVTGSTSLSYEKIYEGMHRRDQNKKEEFQATMRPYTLADFNWLLEQLQKGNEKRLGRTKLHQLHEAILKLNCTTTILESLALFRNWKEPERDFIREIVKKFDTHLTAQQRKQRGTLFPWCLESKEETKAHDIYRTPLLDFIELYDFVSS